MGAVFLGTPAAAVPSLSALAQVEDIVAVVTQPDRPAKRSSAPIPPPVKVAAMQFGFPVAQPTNRSELDTVLSGLDASFGLVVAYGRILSADTLSIVPRGFLNIHFSLLPRWRGAAPVERAIAAGDETTGVTLMKIDEGLDTGPIIAERVTTIAPTETGGSLTARLAHLGAVLVDDAVPDYLSGRRVPVPQIAIGASHAAMLSKSEARLHTGLDPESAARMVRAYNPRPGAWVDSDVGAIRVHEAVAGGRSGLPVGTIGQEHGSVVWSMEGGSLILGSIQPSGKPRMDAGAWSNGRRGEAIQTINP